MHVETRSFMISLSTFCFMLALAGYPPHVFQPNIYHLISSRRRSHPTTRSNAIPTDATSCDLRGADPIPLSDPESFHDRSQFHNFGSHLIPIPNNSCGDCVTILPLFVCRKSS